MGGEHMSLAKDKALDFSTCNLLLGSLPSKQNTGKGHRLCFLWVALVTKPASLTELAHQTTDHVDLDMQENVMFQSKKAGENA